MRLIKGFGFVIVGLFVFITLFSLIIPSKVMTTNAEVMYASPEKIMGALTDFDQWQKWHPVFLNANSSIKISKQSSGVNASIAWESTGKTNTLTITEILPDGIRVNLSRPGETTVENLIVILPLPENESYQVEWKALTRLRWYPWEKFSGIFVSEMTSPGYQAALSSLKDFTEAK